MDQQPANSLRQGVAAYQAGDKAQARTLLLKAVREEPDNEQAWGWLSNVSENEDEKIRCLRQVLRINPSNSAARKMVDDYDKKDWPHTEKQTVPPAASASSTLWPAVKTKKSRPWYRSEIFYVLCALFFFPAFVLLILTDENFKAPSKIAVISIQIVLCVVGGGLAVLRGPSTYQQIMNAQASNQEYIAPTAPILPSPTPPSGAINTGNGVTILPPGSNLQGGKWLYKVTNVEVAPSISYADTTDWSKQGRFVIIRLNGTNASTGTDMLIPPVGAFLINASGSYAIDQAESAAAAFSKNMEPGVQLHPNDNGDILAVFDVPPSTTTKYILTIFPNKTGLLVDVPTQ